MSETWQQRYWGQAGRQAGTMLKGVCSRAHILTHSTDVCWNNTGVNTEHLKITVQAGEDGSPPPKRWFSWPTKPEPEARRRHPRASNCRVTSHVPPWRRVFESPLRRKNKTKTNPKDSKKQTNKQKSNIITGIRIGGKTFFLSSRIKVYMKISHASC